MFNMTIEFDTTKLNFHALREIIISALEEAGCEEISIKETKNEKGEVLGDGFVVYESTHTETLVNILTPLFEIEKVTESQICEFVGSELAEGVYLNWLSWLNDHSGDVEYVNNNGGAFYKAFAENAFHEYFQTK